MKINIMKFLVATIFIFVVICPGVSAQTYLKVDADSVRVVGGEIVIDNQTNSIKGILTNQGNGATQFQRLRLIGIGDSAVAISGQDTLNLKNSSSASKSYYLLSKNIAIKTHNYYHPLAFETPLDSGKTYHVHALLYLETIYPFDKLSVFRAQYSDAIYTEQATPYSTLRQSGGMSKYSLLYDKVIKSRKRGDTLRLSFSTDLDNQEGKTILDSLSYMETEEFIAKKFLP